MQAYQCEFIEFMVRAEVLRFGDFVTKSGRPTPFFINTGRYDTGAKIARLGEFYAAALLDKLAAVSFDCLFGPAYKGIPLVVASAIALAARGRDVPFAFNRKEAKDHGEGGVIVGHPIAPGERVLVIEDVTTAGTSIGETQALLDPIAGARMAGLLVSVDRQERGAGDRAALEDIALRYDMPAVAIVTLSDILEYLHGRTIDGHVVLDDLTRMRIEEYRKHYGPRVSQR